ncbi:MAG: hypothetical protein M3139_05875 [Bacteroidota bacterium]|nr:hypothetical protein [Bacteroidota bacterium]
MQDFKDKLFNYEDEPPAEIWERINSELDTSNPKAFPIRAFRRRSKVVFYGITAAASLIIIFLLSVVFNGSKKNNGDKNSLASAENGKGNVTFQKIKDSLKLNNKTLEDIIKSSKDNKLLAQNYQQPASQLKKYITISGPSGQPVKISPKVATLIVSADNEYPPKPVWNKKIEKWKQIMLNTTLSPTSTNLLDIAQLTSNLDNNE